jgi:hypothetical protein
LVNPTLDPQNLVKLSWGWKVEDVGHSIHVIPNQPNHSFHPLHPEQLCHCGPLVRWEEGRRIVTHQPWN